VQATLGTEKTYNGGFLVNNRAGFFAWTIIGTGVTVLAISVHQVLDASLRPQWVTLCALAALSGLAVLRVPSIPATFSLGESFSFAALFLYGPAAGAITCALDSLATNLRLRRRTPVQALFNVAAPAIAMWTAGMIGVHALGAIAVTRLDASVWMTMTQVVLAASMFFLTETGLIATAISLDKQTPTNRVWRGLLRLWVTPMVGAYVGFLVALLSPVLGTRFLLLVVPIPIIVHYTVRLWIERTDDHIRHLTDMNQSHQAIITALAAAVDAKDGITHGHVQRVQQYCLALAHKLHISDTDLLRALETAGLLHDIGKLGIPDCILNKPGALTPAEYHEMKQHSLIGANILSSIEFPYPLLPIVRHHHENWDGHGYPDGLAGEDIPIGARILMVVDCFDALTSDRPYRGALPADQALAIVKSRRGTMYDPRIVDAFLEMQQESFSGGRRDHLVSVAS
jgi:putative nucleotidyltransferase with HDIG domain